MKWWIPAPQTEKHYQVYLTTGPSIVGSTFFLRSSLQFLFAAGLNSKPLCVATIGQLIYTYKGYTLSIEKLALPLVKYDSFQGGAVDSNEQELPEEAGHLGLQPTLFLCRHFISLNSIIIVRQAVRLHENMATSVFIWQH